MTSQSTGKGVGGGGAVLRSVAAPLAPTPVAGTQLI